ncbi:hypothetical protein J2X67_002587 [Variovorax sp. 3319]|nr:hypothetical protein [Variovorax sp. 3319]
MHRSCLPRENRKIYRKASTVPMVKPRSNPFVRTLKLVSGLEKTKTPWHDRCAATPAAGHRRRYGET